METVTIITSVGQRKNLSPRQVFRVKQDSKMNKFCFTQGHRDANHARSKIYRLSFFSPPPASPHLFVISKDPAPLFDKLTLPCPQWE